MLVHFLRLLLVCSISLHHLLVDVGRMMYMFLGCSFYFRPLSLYCEHVSPACLLDRRQAPGRHLLAHLVLVLLPPLRETKLQWMLQD